MRLWHKALLSIVLLLSLAVAIAYWYAQKALAALPVSDLTFDITSVSLHRLQFAHVQFRANTIPASVTLQDVDIRWQFSDGFNVQLQQVLLGSGTIELANWPVSDAKNTAPASTVTVPSSWQLPAFLPDTVDIAALRISLPCFGARCDYLLNATMQRQAQQLQLKLNANSAVSPSNAGLTLEADYQMQQGLPLVNAKLQLDNSISLSVVQQLQQHSTLMAQGEIKLQIAPPSPWLVQQLKQWQLELPPDALQRFSSPVTVNSRWQIELPDNMDLANFSQRASGNVQLNAHLPTPLLIPHIGQLQGDMQANVALTGGELSHYQLHSQLTLLQPQMPGSLLQYGIGAEQLAISLSADGKTAPQLTALPLQVKLRSDGQSALNVSANATLNLTPPLSAALKDVTLQLNQKSLQSDNRHRIQQLQLDSRFDAYWLADSWQLMLQSANVQIGTLQLGDSSASNVKLSLQPGKLSGNSDFNTLQFNTELTLSAQLLQHELLKPLNWRWQGKLNGDLTNYTAAGTLNNSADLTLQHQLQYQPDNLNLNWQLDEIFLLAGNPLQASLAQWPALLEFNRGRIMGSGSISVSPQVAVQASVKLSGVSGIYDRSLFKDLTTPLKLTYQGDKIELNINELTLSEIQHGLNGGPLKLTADYRADANTLGAGMLDIKQLQLLAMGGQISVTPTQLDLAMEQQEIVLQLQRIDLAKLLQQHPTTDLSGKGLLSGTVPVQINRNGISVNRGAIAAESPGGILQYRPPAAKNMTSGNQGMKVVLDALHDFHYSVLSSDISYDTHGQLTLALRLKGYNPALEAGRAVNLNINLQEDVPAMITSLQLSSQISDKIKQRVQQHLQQSGAKRANGVKL